MSAPRKAAWMVFAAGVLCIAAACADRFFAPGARSAARAQLTLTATMAPAGGSAAAFDHADAIRVRVSRANASVLDTTFAFRSSGADTRVQVPIAFDSASLAVRIDVELRAGTQPLFGGGTGATLTKGQITPVTIELTPVVAALAVAPVPTFTALGDTAWAHGAVVFATGDTIRTLRPIWTSLTPTIVAAGPDSLLVARGEGQGQIRAEYGSVFQYVPVTVNAVVASLYLTPRDPSPGVGPYPIQFSTAVRDRRGNLLTRTVTYVSRNTSVVTIDANGLAQPVNLGKTWIVASVGTVRDSTTFTVGGVLPPAPAAPTSLMGRAVSSGEIGLSWQDNSTDETGFYVERCTGVDCGAFAQVGNLVGTTARVGTTNMSNAQLAASTSYTYRVRAYNSGGNSAYSNTATVATNPPEIIPPGTPDSLTATPNATTATTIDLRWKPTGTVATGFRIERCTGGNCLVFTEIRVLYGASVVGTQDINLTPATSYSYRIRAFNGYGNSGYSNTATARTP